MMRLSTMWKVDHTIGANGSSPVAERIMERWEHDRDSIRFFRSSANFVYVVRHDDTPYFLRFADSSERRREAIEAEVDLVTWLAGRGIAVSRPVWSRNGQLVETVVTDHGTFHAVVFAGLAGAHLDLSDLDAARWRAWGAALGRLHTTTKDYAEPSAVARRTWRDDLALAGDVLTADTPWVRDEIQRLGTALAALPVGRDTYGLIHGDCELDNLCWRDDVVEILDFDDCAHHWYVADIAFALRDLFAGNVDLHDRSFREFVRGYAMHHPLDECLLAQVPLFLRLAALLGHARLARALDLPADGTYPDWLVGLRRKLEGRLAAYRAALTNAGG